MVNNGKNNKRRFRQRNPHPDRMRRETPMSESLTRSRSRSPRHFSRSSRPSPFYRRGKSPVRVLDDRQNQSYRGYSPCLDRPPNRVSERYSPRGLYMESGSAFPSTSYNSYGDSEPQRNTEHIPVFEPPSDLITQDELWQQSFGRGSPRANETWKRDDVLSGDSQRRDVQNRFIEPNNTWLQDRNLERSRFMQNVPDASRNMNSTFVPNFPSPEDAHPQVPPFDGISQDINSKQWIQIIDDIGEKERWTIEKKRFQMLSAFSGPAREWLLKEQIFSYDNWGKLSKAFISAFPSDMEYNSFLRKLVLRAKQPKETYSNYFTIKSKLLKSCNITGRKAVSCVIGGLSNDDPLRNLAYKQNFPTLESLYDFLVENSNKANHTNAQTNVPVKVDNSAGLIVNQKHFVDLRINGMPLQGYNDMYSEHVTIREEQAPCFKLVSNNKSIVIKGYRGKKITTLGDVKALIRVENVAINMRVHIVPNFVQDVVLVIGDTLRNHRDFRSLRTFDIVENTSFSMNEKLVNINDGRIEPSNPNDFSRFQNNQQSQRSQRSNDFCNTFGAIPARLHNR